MHALHLLRRGIGEPVEEGVVTMGDRMKKKWKAAHRQARAIGKAETAEDKRKAVLLWCKEIRHALGVKGKADA